MLDPPTRPKGLQDYAAVHWPRHIPSLQAFGVTTHGIWTDHDPDAHRLVALIASPDGAEPGEVTAASMTSPEFAADMKGFDVSNILNVEELLLDPTSAPPPPTPHSRHLARAQDDQAAAADLDALYRRWPKSADLVRERANVTNSDIDRAR